MGKPVYVTKINQLFSLLGCTNVEIAGLADCDRSYISHIRRGSRSLQPGSSGLLRLVAGLYRYADKENRLSVLVRLSSAPGETREELLPALTAWLFDAKSSRIPASVKLPPKEKAGKRDRACRLFGEKLDAVMQLLELSNARLARNLSVDDSLISRFRRGIRSPERNREMSERLTESLFSRFGDEAQLQALARLSGLSVPLLREPGEGLGAFRAWLFDKGEKQAADGITALLASLEAPLPAITEIPRDPLATDSQDFAKDKAADPDSEAGPLRTTTELYRGLEGFRAASLRFLREAAEEGGELFLYSDEDLEWMTGDPSYMRLWALGMQACLQRGVRIQIVHNVDRGMEELLAAIRAWIPLYMSGLIEPYVARRPRDARFHRSLFLRGEKACVHSASTGESRLRYYEYITDTERLSCLREDFVALRAFSDPLLKIYLDQEQWKLYSHLPPHKTGRAQVLLSSLSLATLPGETLRNLLEANHLPPETGRLLLETHASRQLQLRELLSQAGVCEFVFLPPPEAGQTPGHRLYTRTELLSQSLLYTPEAFREHVLAVVNLLETEKNYHLYFLPEPIYPGMQVLLQDQGVSVIRSTPPAAAFVFTHPLLCQGFETYFAHLRDSAASDRSEVRRRLLALLDVQP